MIAEDAFPYAPGASFQYSPWHMAVAGAMALKALGQPRTEEAWVQVLNDELFAPLGLAPPECLERELLGRSRVTFLRSRSPV